MTQKEKDTKETKESKSSRTHTPVEGYKIEELRAKSVSELTKIAKGIGIENPQEYRRQDLM